MDYTDDAARYLFTPGQAERMAGCRAGAAIRDRGLPVVSAEARPDDGPETMYAGIDDRAAARSAAEHVIRLGHRRVAVLSIDLAAGCRTGPVDLESPERVDFRISRERLLGVRDALVEVGLGWSDLTVINAGGNTREHGAQATAYALDRADRSTAILTYSDVLALGVLDALAARGLRGGRDVSVAGFDDIPEAATVGLTTVRQPAAQKGVMAAHLLLNPPAEPERRRLLLPAELVVRASTGPV